MKVHTILAAVTCLASSAQAFATADAIKSSSSTTALSSSSASTTLIGEVDAQTEFDKSSFPIKPEDLIKRAKEVLSPSIGIGTKDDGACIADDFEFCAAVVGPLPKEEYLAALKSFSLEDSWELTQNYFGFTVDPLQTNRVWFFTRQMAKQIAPFMGVDVDASKEDLTMPPQLLHMDFNGDGKVREFGFYTADRRQGNTGGLGGAFGFFYGVGKPLPIPECRPFKRSWQFRTFNAVSRLGSKLSNMKARKTKE